MTNIPNSFIYNSPKLVTSQKSINSTRTNKLKHITAFHAGAGRYKPMRNDY